MDGFKVTVLVTLLISLAAIGVIAFVLGDAISNVRIPDQQYGTIEFKGPVTDNRPANYTVKFTDGKQFYIISNTTIYESLELNKSYLFNCRIDIKNQMVIIDSAWQTDRGIP
ncbi:MAG: hypothetical protein LBQ98_04545 [Nitrososphaerota archaeon]|nr:hypothetical protein [Nitrososphaerota archaeon]